MTKIFFLAGCLSVCISEASTQPLKATIKIDIDRGIGTIDPLLYGNFTEHLGRCIYGGIYDPASPQANADGFRKDVIAATKNLGVSIIRWPGGNFSSGYHWMDGIGPRENRPKRKDLAWGDTEPNIVGTDEFMKFTRATGAAPYICVNLGTGSWDEARNWVEYCNAPRGFYYSDLRAKNGHPEPYHVKYWGLGNEIDGPWQMGHRDADDYAKFALEAAKLMKWSDDSIKLIASGSSNYGADWINWNKTVLTTLRDHIDYISLHHYSGNYNKDHYQFMAINTRVEDIIRTTEGLINQVRLQYHTRHPVYIAFDEYNVWYRAFNEQKLEEHYNMQDVLVVAMYLNTFLRHANIVKMANMAQLVNVIAPMMVTHDTLWLQTIYYPLQLFAINCRGESLDSYLQCDRYDAGEFKQVPYLDVSSVWNRETGELIINVVNRHQDKAIETSILNQAGKLADKGTVYEINSESLYDENSVSAQKVKPVTREINIGGDAFHYSFPPHSFTMIKIKIKS
ncbi:MAG TPA: alpha-L-arabinofuranosidase C-terminal domain-containing protein [Puia sp.]|nr:alpha-L-arabinofuranosidase C-terminal domain-containing protein [Puia sp.]